MTDGLSKTEWRQLMAAVQEIRASQIRADGKIDSMDVILVKMNGSIESAVKCGHDNTVTLARHDERISSLAKTMSKVIWGIGVPVIIMMIRAAVDVILR